MLNLHLLECTLKGYDHISDLLLAKYWVITGCKYYCCISLVSVTIGNGVTSISTQAFYDCSSLTSVSIGAGITYVSGYAFYKCSSMTDLYCHANIPPTLYSSSYNPPFPSYGENTTLYVPKECGTKYKSSDWAKYFKTIKEMD